MRLPGTMPRSCSIMSELVIGLDAIALVAPWGIGVALLRLRRIGIRIFIGDFSLCASSRDECFNPQP